MPKKHWLSRNQQANKEFDGFFIEIFLYFIVSSDFNVRDALTIEGGRGDGLLYAEYAFDAILASDVWVLPADENV